MTKPKFGKKATSKAAPKAKVEKTEVPETAHQKTEAFIHYMATNPKWRGIVQVKAASQYSVPYHLRRPTGIMGLDLALGGGFPAGGGSQIYGVGSSGKTYLAFRTAGQMQQNYGDRSVIFIGCSEIRLDKGFARRAGFCIAYSDDEIREMDGIRVQDGKPPFTPEEWADLRLQVGEVVLSAGVTGDVMLDTTIAAIEHYGNDLQLIIIESLGALLTPDQDKKDVGDRVYGGSSGMITTWQNKSYPLFMLDTIEGKCLETTVLGINQVRAVLDSNPHGPKTRPAAGAKSWEHAQLINLELKVGETLYEDAAKTKKNGHTIKWEIRKGKAGTHDGLRGEYNWFHMDSKDPVFWGDYEAEGHKWGPDTNTDLCDTALLLDVALQGGAFITFNDGIGPEVKVRGTKEATAKEQFATLVASDPEFNARVRNACIRKAGLTVRFK